MKTCDCFSFSSHRFGKLKNQKKKLFCLCLVEMGSPMRAMVPLLRQIMRAVCALVARVNERTATSGPRDGDRDAKRNGVNDADEAATAALMMVVVVAESHHNQKKKRSRAAGGLRAG